MSTSALRGVGDGGASPVAPVEPGSIPSPRRGPDAGTGGPAPRVPDAGAGPPKGGVTLDDHLLLSGYLTAVARRLEQRGIPVKETHAHCSESGRLSGLLTLAPPVEADGARWAPARLEWEEDRGWSATLVPTGDVDEARSAGVQRFLPRKLVPAPVTVAHFVAALNADEHTIWACATFRPPRRADRRWLILQLSRFALPEPWQPPPVPGR